MVLLDASERANRFLLLPGKPNRPHHCQKARLALRGLLVASGV